MTDRDVPFRITVDEWRMSCLANGEPVTAAKEREAATLVDELTACGNEFDSRAWLTVSRRALGWPDLVITCRYSSAGGFYPGALIVPEARTLLLGCGEVLAAYRLDPYQRRWQDQTACGFWEWGRHGDIVVMAAELEIAAFSLDGTRIWSTDIEPPWSYVVRDGELVTDVMGVETRFNLHEGPGRSLMLR